MEYVSIVLNILACLFAAIALSKYVRGRAANKASKTRQAELMGAVAKDIRVELSAHCKMFDLLKSFLGTASNHLSVMSDALKRVDGERKKAAQGPPRRTPQSPRKPHGRRRPQGSTGPRPRPRPPSERRRAIGKPRDDETAETHEGFVVAYLINPEKHQGEVGAFLPGLESHPDRMMTSLDAMMKAGEAENVAVKHFRWSARLLILAFLLSMTSFVLQVVQQHLVL